MCQQHLVDLQPDIVDGSPLSLAETCTTHGIPADIRDADDRFIDWCFTRPERAVHAVELDAVATARLAVAAIAARRCWPQALRDGVEPPLDNWLRRTGRWAARMSPSHLTGHRP